MTGNRPSILIVTPSFAPELTGVGRYTGELAAGLAARGHRVEVITTPPHYPGWWVREPYSAARYQSEEWQGVKVIRCPLIVRRNASGLLRLAASVSFGITASPVLLWRALRSGPKVILCIEPTLAAAPAALIAAYFTNARTALHVQDLELDAALAVGHVRSSGLLLKAMTAVERCLTGAFDRVITISTKMRDLLARKGVAEDRMEILRNWVDVTRIRPLDGLSPYRAELGIAPDRFVCLYSGQIGRKQALHLMLDAAEALKDDGRFVFVVGGDGPEREALVARYGNLPNVHFLPLQPEERLCDFLGLADCHVLPQDAGVSELVLPSKVGGMLASGRRILVTADQGTELALFLDGCAAIVPPGDAQAIVSGLTAMVEAADDGAARRLALAGTLSAASSLGRFSEVLTALAERRA